MKKKHYLILTGFALMILILGCVIYDKYHQYLPTLADEVQFPVALSDSQIEKIRKDTPIHLIKVYKEKRLVELLDQNNQIIRQYPMRLGFDPIGHKVQEGDGKTPEGHYVIDWRNPNSAFYKSLHVSYPNTADQAHAKSLGVSAGGNIMIHGSATKKQVQTLPKLMTYFPKSDWTWGCIAVRNVDIDEIWKLIDNGTEIKIYP